MEHHDEQAPVEELTEIVRLGLLGGHEPGLEHELSDEDLMVYGGHRPAVSLVHW